MLKKILLVSLIGSLSLFAADKVEPNKKQSLYKNLYAGELTSKYPEYFKDKETIDCKIIGIPVGNIAKCTIVSDNESLGIEKDFSMVVSTIEDRVNSVHLIKIEENSSLTANFWPVLFKSGFKSYATFDSSTSFPEKMILKDNTEFIKDKLKLEQQLLLSKKSFVIDTLFLDTDIKIGEKMSFVDTLKEDPSKITRMAEIIESFDIDTQTWVYRIDFTNPFYQAVLQQLYSKHNKLNEAGGI